MRLYSLPVRSNEVCDAWPGGFQVVVVVLVQDVKVVVLHYVTEYLGGGRI